MDTYSFLRQLADSWVLLAMFAFFVSVIAFAFRPGSTATYDAVANIPLQDDTKPAPHDPGVNGTAKAKGTAKRTAKGTDSDKGADHV